MTVSILASSVSRAGGGLFPSLLGFASGLIDLGVDVRVFGLRDGQLDQDAAAWPALIRPTTFRVRGPDAFGFAPGLGNGLAQVDADLLHLHGLWMYPSVAASRWRARSGRSVVISPHGMLDPWAVRRSGWKKRLAHTFYESENLRSAACLHALNEAEASAIRLYGLRNPICVIPNGVDLPDCSASNRMDGERRCVFLGRIHPKKGLANLLQAWAKAARGDEWKLEIAGWDQGGHEKELRRLAEKLQLQSSVRFVGPKFGAEKEAFLRGAAVFLLPSLSEGLPVAVLEAWSYRLPVVMTPECNLPEGFDSGAAIRSEGDVDSLAAALKCVMELPDQGLQEMGMRGRRLVEGRFAWPRISRQMVDVYSWLLNGGTRPDTVQTF